MSKTNQSTSRSGSTPQRVLIIDDDSFLTGMYSAKFSQEGFTVETAASAQEALDKVANNVFQPDICLIDIVIPTMDGFELLGKLRAEPSTKEAALIMLSNLSQQSDIKKGQELGADGYIVKADHTPSEVVEKVMEIVGLK